MEQTNSASLKPLADAADYEEFESLANEQAAPAQQLKAEEKTAKTSVPKGEEPAGETAAAPEAAQPQEQKQQPKRKHDAEARIGELTKREKDAIARAEAAERQLEEFRKTSVSQESRPAPDTRQQPAPPAKLGKLADYVKAEHVKRPNVLQEELIEEWVTKRDAEAEQARQAKAAQERFHSTVKEFRTKRSDVDPDDVFGSIDGRKSGIILGTAEANVMGALTSSFQNWADVLYYLHDNPEEYQQIRNSSPQEQWFDVVAIARQLARGTPPFSQAAPVEPSAQEQPKNVRPISRVPAPAKHTLGGGMPPEAKSMRDARDFEEAEAIEKRRVGGGR